MSENEHICPLCCEELDLSDREFYPCKCGYQVCMWCWHRIRETESGLCPACRTPYGEDPHQFTALDVQDVLKANKAQAAAKKERSQSSTSILNGHDAPSTSQLDHNNNDNQSTNSSEAAIRDRSQLANMRVIRRNLVYAVGLPPSLATEEILRKPEYFGQYGKIAKIVLNRSQVQAASEGPDPSRRASASAYVTFQYKQDALTCILALDGYYFENRNIRASFGTSKYCSAFIKCVRCSNPECTYLHELGAKEDTFTKQEIQAGYVTSGKDVLARQQQIMAELQETGNGHGASRKLVGGGGPSGTGRASASPVFPPPEFDESLRVQLEAPSRPVVAKRASTSQVSMPAPVALRGRVNRSASVGANASVGGVTGMGGVQRKVASNSSLGGLSAASVVAGIRPASKEPAENSHSTLTTLTPLVKRSTTKVTGTARAAIDNKTTKNLQKTSDSKPADAGLIGGAIIGPRGSRATHSNMGLNGNSMISVNDPVYTEPKGRSIPIGGNTIRSTPATSNVSEDSNTALIGGTILPTGTGLSAAPSLQTKAPTNAGVIGLRPGSSTRNSGSSELASLLGIKLPSGDSMQGGIGPFWSAPSSGPTAPSPLASLNGSPHLDPPLSQTSSMQYSQQHSMNNGSSDGLIGGIPIGGRDSGSGVSRPASNGSLNNDMAVLQSLLPSVNVTTESSLAGGTPSWMQSGQGLGTGAIGGDLLQSWNGNTNRSTIAELRQQTSQTQHGTIGRSGGNGGQVQSSRMW